MESKKKKKLILTIALVAVFMICAVIGSFVVIKKVNKKHDSSKPATNMSTDIDQRLIDATIDIMDNKISPNYNGNYKFKIVGDITFNSKLTISQIESICINKFGTNSVDGIRNYLNNKKKNEVTSYNEKIVLKNGRYTKSYNETKVIEKGRYFGNDDISEISILNNEKYTPKYEMSLSGIKGTFNSTSMNEDLNPERTKLYIYQHVYNLEKTHLLFTITYVYEMLENTTLSIPNSALDFEL